MIFAPHSAALIRDMNQGDDSSLSLRDLKSAAWKKQHTEKRNNTKKSTTPKKPNKPRNNIKKNLKKHHKKTETPQKKPTKKQHKKPRNNTKNKQHHKRNSSKPAAAVLLHFPTLLRHTWGFFFLSVAFLSAPGSSHSKVSSPHQSPSAEPELDAGAGASAVLTGAGNHSQLPALQAQLRFAPQHQAASLIAQHRSCCQPGHSLSCSCSGVIYFSVWRESLSGPCL